MSARDWIAARRELLDAATDGPWSAIETAWGKGLDGPEEAQIFVESYGVTWAPNPADAALIADARTSLPMALDALHGVLAKHYEGDSSYGYAPNGDYVDLGPCCETCGTNGEYGVPWPCPTVTAIAGALGVEP